MLGDRLAQVPKSIYIPGDILAQLEHSLLTDKSQQEVNSKQQREPLQRLDGRISEEFWARKSAE